MTRWSALLLFAWIAACHRPEPKAILLVTFDTTRPDHLGAYGYRLADTPAFDALALGGARFAAAGSTAPITLPSHTSMLTGLLPPAHGVRDNGAFALSEDAVTLAEHLSANGYATAAFVSALVLDGRYGLEQGFDLYEDDLSDEPAASLFMVKDRTAAHTADAALAWLSAWRPTAEHPHAFLWVHFYDPHQPYDVASVDAVRFPSPYDAEIAAADDGLGRVVDAVRARFGAENALMAVTADHGESLGEHGERTHALFVYEATMRVPWVLAGPGVTPGTVVDDPVSTVDLAPTLLDLAGVPPLPRAQGRSLVGALRGEELAPRPLYFESLLTQSGFGMAPLSGVRVGDARRIRAPRPETYALDADPSELHNLAGADPGRDAALDQALDDLLAASAQVALTPRTTVADQQTTDALVALGYAAPGRVVATGMDPKDGLPLYQAVEDARHAVQRDQLDEAERLLRGVLDQTPANVSARNVLALVLARQGRAEAAEAAWRESLAIDPGQHRVLFQLASMATQRGELDAATTLLDAAIALVPGFVEAVAWRGAVTWRQGREAEALGWLERARAADPTSPLALTLVADAAWQQGRWGEAHRGYEAAVAVSPDDLGLRLQAGLAAWRAGDPAAARAHWAAAAERHPKSWRPPYNQACLSATEGNVDEAFAWLDRARALGIEDAALLQTDPDLARLRSDPRWRR
jgi:choline-sulfatase